MTDDTDNYRNVYVVELCARVAYEAARVTGVLRQGKSAPIWEVAREEDRELARTMVTSLWYEEDASPEEIHQAWLDECAEDGWQYGPAHDVKARHNPLMLPFKQLPERQQIGAALYKSIVDAMRRQLTGNERTFH